MALRAHRTVSLAGIAGALLGLVCNCGLAQAASLTSCAGQVFSQPFSSWKDCNYYTLVPGGEFNSPNEGWELYGGAKIITGVRPNGSRAGVLDLPSGSVAVSPPECVTFAYPTARVWVRDLKGAEGVMVAVAYLGTSRTITSPQNVGQVHGQQSKWTLSNPFNVQPQIGGGEGTREARFVLAAPGKSSEYQLYGLWVDPRMN